MKKISFNDYIPEELADNESCRLITTEQYQEYLKLKEEHKPLSWEELKEEAKKMGYELQKDYLEYLSKCFGKDLSFTFQEYGDVCIDAVTDYCDINITFTEHRTPDQMLAIMKALQ